jgi:hypothetical protein
VNFILLYLKSRATIKFNQKLLEQKESLDEWIPLTKKSKKDKDQTESAGQIRIKVQFGKSTGGE